MVADHARIDPFYLGAYAFIADGGGWMMTFIRISADAILIAILRSTRLYLSIYHQYIVIRYSSFISAGPPETPASIHSSSSLLRFREFALVWI